MWLRICAQTVRMFREYWGASTDNLGYLILNSFHHFKGFTSVCCLHIYSYLELTGQGSIFSYFQFHFHFLFWWFPVSCFIVYHNVIAPMWSLNQAVTFSSFYDRPICKLNYNFQVLYFISIHAFFCGKILILMFLIAEYFLTFFLSF